MTTTKQQSANERQQRIDAESKARKLAFDRKHADCPPVEVPNDMTPDEALAVIQASDDPWCPQLNAMFARANGEPPPADESLIEWLEAQTWSEFAQSLARQHRSGRKLSAKQIASGESMRAKVEAKRAAKPDTPAAKPDTGLDLTPIPSGYYAPPNGDTRLKLKIDNVEKGKWAGFIFVKDGAVYGEGQRYGMQRPGETYRGQVQDALAAILADPTEAMKAYGRLTGTCGRCGRKLEDATSVAEGIGPYCATQL